MGFSRILVENDNFNIKDNPQISQGKLPHTVDLIQVLFTEMYQRVTSPVQCTTQR